MITGAGTFIGTLLMFFSNLMDMLHPFSYFLVILLPLILMLSLVLLVRTVFDLRLYKEVFIEYKINGNTLEVINYKNVSDYMPKTDTRSDEKMFEIFTIYNSKVKSHEWDIVENFGFDYDVVSANSFGTGSIIVIKCNDKHQKGSFKLRFNLIKETL